MKGAIETLLPCVQAMDLPVDVWEGVRKHMHPRQWAKACSACRAAFALRRTLVAAELCNDRGDDQQATLRRLHLGRWPACHSLYLNLSCMDGGWQYNSVDLTALAVFKIILPNHAAPLLFCLHLIGRRHVSLTEDSIEGLLVRQLARHVSVLTLQVRRVSMPLHLPTLQHLVLELFHTYDFDASDYEALIPAVSMLKSLKTLFVRSGSFTSITGPTDLTGCPDLHCVALQGVQCWGLLALPPGCLLHGTSQFAHTREIAPAVAPLLTGLTLHHSSLKPYDMRWWHPSGLLMDPHVMCKLKRLRLTLHAFDLDDELVEEKVLRVVFGPEETPGLEVLDLDVHLSLAIFIDPALALKRLVLITAGTLQLDFRTAYQAPMLTLKLMYLHSGSVFVPPIGAAPQAFPARPSWATLMQEHGKQEEDGWTMQIPGTLHPGNLQECFCGACPDCLVRAGVPILCAQAITEWGFSKHLRAHCDREH